jgi:PqqD family protein of HPr-rel-A system
LYHHPSGKTHLLNEGAGLLLTRVLRQPLHAREAAERLAQLQGAVADEQFCHYIAQLLARFDELGLVQRIASSSSAR